MIRRITTATLQFGALAFWLAAFLFGSGEWRQSSGVISSILTGFDAIFLDSKTQWMVLACLVFYFIALSIFELRSCRDAKSRRFEKPILWQGVLLALALFGNTIGYERSWNSPAIVVLFAAIIFGKIVATWMRSQNDRHGQRAAWVVDLLILFLAVAAVWQPEPRMLFQYRGVSRWSGVWDNPNLFGLLMGAAVVLSLGMAVKNGQITQTRISRVIGPKLFLLAIFLTGYALFKSYSRGAWLGTVVGLGYLLRLKVQDSKRINQSFWQSWRLLKFVLPIVFALTTVSFWQFRFIEWTPARRVFSAANFNDFSWRNRVAAWRGAVQMMSARPLIGFGWGDAKSVYGKKYRPPQMETGAAIQMNDYFMLGISGGVPALVCFLVYVGLSLRSPRPAVHVSQLPRGPDSGAEVSDFQDLAWLQATCRAGAIVLLVGFFFDGGLFKLATGSVFWILLELGRADRYRSGAEARRVSDVAIEVIGLKSSELSLAPPDKINLPEPTSSGKLATWEIWLRRAAWILGIAAVSESAVFLGTPFLGVNNTTLAISRHYLVPPSAEADLNLLATNVDWSSRKLRPLLQHASLANYNRQLINWKLDDAIYRDYVLNPSIDPARDGQLAWRRKLWEYFYLPMRKENDPASAAQIVLKFLHLRIATVPDGPATIEEMWQAKQADEKGIQALEVAAFRSVGIPARLTGNGHAELFSDGKWQALPDRLPAPESAERK